MPELRSLITALETSGELLRISRPVDPRFELPALLKQAEARRKAILFASVTGCDFPVVGGLLTDASRFATGLGQQDAATYTREQHRDLVVRAISQPLSAKTAGKAPCKEVVLAGAEVDLARLPAAVDRAVVLAWLRLER